MLVWLSAITLLGTVTFLLCFAIAAYCVGFREGVAHGCGCASPARSPEPEE
jgi:hypothetical protein